MEQTKTTLLVVSLFMTLSSAHSMPRKHGRAWGTERRQGSKLQIGKTYERGYALSPASSGSASPGHAAEWNGDGADFLDTLPNRHAHTPMLDLESELADAAKFVREVGDVLRDNKPLCTKQLKGLTTRLAACSGIINILASHATVADLRALTPAARKTLEEIARLEEIITTRTPHLSFQKIGF